MIALLALQWSLASYALDSVKRIAPDSLEVRAMWALTATGTPPSALPIDSIRVWYGTPPTAMKTKKLAASTRAFSFRVKRATVAEVRYIVACLKWTSDVFLADGKGTRVNDYPTLVCTTRYEPGVISLRVTPDSATLSPGP
jgi:hypothetical protein